MMKKEDFERSAASIAAVKVIANQQVSDISILQELAFVPYGICRLRAGCRKSARIVAPAPLAGKGKATDEGFR